MKVEFWFDPVCPFCWMTSRWVISVGPERDLDIDWLPISLLFKNELEPEDPLYDKVLRTHALLRVVESVRAAGHADRIGELYTRFGRHIHHEERLHFDVAAELEAIGLDVAHAEALTDDAFDLPIRASMDEGLELTGDEVGTPIIAITGSAGRVALFGPVITEFPAGEAGLRLWDGYIAMVETPGFFELKRTRVGTPDMSSIPG